MDTLFDKWCENDCSSLVGSRAAACADTARGGGPEPGVQALGERALCGYAVQKQVVPLAAKALLLSWIPRLCQLAHPLTQGTVVARGETLSLSLQRDREGRGPPEPGSGSVDRAKLPDVFRQT
jgi:hypothetical protein